MSEMSAAYAARCDAAEARLAGSRMSQTERARYRARVADATELVLDYPEAGILLAPIIRARLGAKPALFDGVMADPG